MVCVCRPGGSRCSDRPRIAERQVDRAAARPLSRPDAAAGCRESMVVGVRTGGRRRRGLEIERPRASVAGTGGDRRVGCCSGMRGLRNRARRWRTDRDVPASECRRCAVVPPTVGGNRRARGV